MTSDELVWQILRSSRFSQAIVTVATESISESFKSVTLNQEQPSVDWSHALFCCSAIGSDAPEEAQDAALRIVQGCLASPNSQQMHREAAVILLERMGNGPALDLAHSRELIDPDELWEAPAPLQLDVMRRRLELTIGTTRGRSIKASVFQREFWDAALQNSWISVSAPTSAGKSFIIRCWFEERLALTETLKCVYLVPTRALIEEVSQVLRADPGFGGVAVHTLPWDPDIGTAGKEVFVVTQERMHVLHQRYPQLRCDLVFVDEAQKFGDDSRGVLLQRVLGEIVGRNRGAQILLASPLSENPELLLSYAPRNVARQSITSTSVTVNQNLLWVNQRKGNRRQWHIQLVLNEALYDTGEFSITETPKTLASRLPLVASALGRFNSGNVVYVNGAADAEKVAGQIYESLDSSFDVDNDPELNALRELAEKTIHPQYALANVLRRRIAFHYGNMPLLLRSEIERLFRENRLNYLVCTSTLLEGVNLPCRSLYVRGPKKGKGRPMSPGDFWNLAGRAGRWGKEFQGNIVCVDTDRPEEWPIPPRARSRQPIRIATDDVLSDVDRLVRYIRDGARLEDAREWPNVEAVFSFLADHVARGNHIADLNGLRINRSDAEIINNVIVESLSRVELPPVVLSQHPGVSPLSMQRLLQYFRTIIPVDRLAFPPPDDYNAAREYSIAIGRISRYLGGTFGADEGRHMQLAILMVSWMRGRPLVWLIADRIRYNNTRPQPQKVGSVIRSTMADVEQYVRFEGPKYLGCYLDVLRHLLGPNSDLVLQGGPDIEMMLELGVSTTTQLSLMTLGLSRTTTIYVSEYIQDENLSPEQCQRWIQSTRLEGLDIPEVVRREIVAKRRPIF